MRKIIFFFQFALFLLPVFAGKTAETGKIRPIFCIDGDTFIAAPDSRVYRLWGVDAPELDQPWGIAARSALIALIHKRRVSVTVHGESYKRPVVEVKHGGRDIGLELLKMGLAHYCPKYAPGRKDYAVAEQEAKAARRGLWSEKEVILPEVWRKSGENELKD